MTDAILERACAACTALCCKGDAIILKPEHGDKPETYDTEPVVSRTTGKAGVMLAHKANGDCTYLENERCSIYERRPVLCRAFDCGKSYARVPRAERRARLSEGVVGRAVIEQGRRVHRAREAAMKEHNP